MNEEQYLSRIRQLESEIEYLHGILDNAGISYKREAKELDDLSPDRNLAFEEDQGSRIISVTMEGQININGSKLKQVASEIQGSKVKQVDSEFSFPQIFAFVPWKHHVLIIQKVKSVEEALFYIRKTIEGNLSRDPVISITNPDSFKSGNLITTNGDHNFLGGYEETDQREEDQHR